MDEVAELKRKLEEWQFRLDGDDMHSIARQLSTMVWWSAFYRSVNESRRHLPIGPDGEPVGNGPLHELLNEGYIALHSAAIRRLVDKGFKTGYSGPKGVNSLYVLVDDIRSHRHLLTRANTLAARGLPYEYEEERERAFQEAWLRAQSGDRPRARWVAQGSWAESEYWHETWDKLCSTHERSPNDSPAEDRFLALLEGLKTEAGDVQAYVDKHHAHASSPESRSLIPVENRSVSHEKLWRAERALLRVMGFLTRCFGSGSEYGGVPVPQFDQFEHIDQPFAVPASIDAMVEAWDQHDKEASACRGWDWATPLSIVEN